LRERQSESDLLAGSNQLPIASYGARADEPRFAADGAAIACEKIRFLQTTAMEGRGFPSPGAAGDASPISIETMTKWKTYCLC
jgi:hypothetical protein